MTNRKLTRQIRRLERLDEKLRRNRLALRRKKRRLRARIGREEMRAKRDIDRKQRNAEKAKANRKRAAEQKHRQRERERQAQERESMEKDMKERRGAAETRSDRSSRLIRLGGLAVIAGLLDMGEKQLLKGIAVIVGDGKLEAYRDLLQAKGRRKAADWEETGRDATMPDLAQVPASDSPVRAIGRHTHRLATMGGVINKAGLGHVDAMVVLGVLVSVVDNEAGRDWTQLPLIAVTLEAVGEEQVAEPLRLAFPRPIVPPLGSNLQDLGLAYLPDNRAWFGVADRSAVEVLAEPCGGAVAPWSPDSPEIRTALVFVQRRRERLASALKTQGNLPSSASRQNSPEKR